jgi:hypothetical protein
MKLRHEVAPRTTTPRARAAKHVFNTTRFDLHWREHYFSLSASAHRQRLPGHEAELLPQLCGDHELAFDTELHD